jgi:SPP1 gp7 family putative phage head morphogenesis protein
MDIRLNKPFAANSRADEADVLIVKRVLNRLGYYRPPAKIGMTDVPDREIFAALKKFQSDRGLAATGTAKPDDKTVAALNKATDANMDGGHYIWRTVGDDKVRPSHAALEGAIRSWDDSPDPGEEANCRCWADSVHVVEKQKNDCAEEEKAWVNAEAKLFIARQNCRRYWKRKNHKKNPS